MSVPCVRVVSAWVSCVSKVGGMVDFLLQSVVNRNARHDLKGHPSACTTCARVDLCEGVWQGYLDIWDDSEFSPLAR